MRLDCNELNRLIADRMLERREIAAALGITTQTIGTWLNGTATPRMSNARKLAEMLKIKPKQIIITERKRNGRRS